MNRRTTTNTCIGCGATRLRNTWTVNGCKLCTRCNNTIRKAARGDASAAPLASAIIRLTRAANA